MFYNATKSFVNQAQKELNRVAEPNDTKEFSFLLEPVQYEPQPKTDIFSYFLQKLSTSPHLMDMYLCKREAFSHEAEQRILITNKYAFLYDSYKCHFAKFQVDKNVPQFYTQEDLADADWENVLSTISTFIQRNSPKSSDNHADTLYLEQVDPCEYIQSVMVHPQAEPWYVEMVQQLCKKHDLPFLGQSSLYKLP